MCADFKPLNKITVKKKFPMPRVDEILDRVQGPAVYSAFNFAEAFLHIPIHPEDRHKTAFHTRTRKLEYTFMPFRLVNAPAELQRQEHLQHLRRALQLLRENHWFVKAQKYSFFMQTISFLGFCVSAAGVEPDPARIEAIQRWPLALYTRTDVQKFLGLASYYPNFIPGFARIAAPLTDFLKKEKQFIWTENEDEAA
ncbi:OSJNBa0079C19.6 protein, related [Eimeria mitis]|uniref:OSJNBa0079C19.6 protein, related n=1 Tax=Eimeria mitis TaxID=44415 RepID=U6KHH3_9EIME|nr:OSJNBa0079C19.6 protein, related [Eimeria mitis]CDJ35727.1 OSJNBa0079C19.6 protein, related [Eimeria mitis]